MVDRLWRTFGKDGEIEMPLTTALWPALADEVAPGDFAEDLAEFRMMLWPSAV